MGKQDPFGTCLDFESYKDCFEELWQEFSSDNKLFAGIQIGTIANCGFLSSDRQITEANQKIWLINPVPIPKGTQ